MINKLLIISLLLLSGCAAQDILNYQPFAPKAEMKNEFSYQVDLGVCRQYALDYLNNYAKLDMPSIASTGAQGGLSNLSVLPTAPAGIAFGGLGRASSEVLKELGLDSADAKRVVAICLHDKGQQSNNYHVYDPVLTQ